jgi:glycosyltransferase involved in cell wall biosynthesis
VKTKYEIKQITAFLPCYNEEANLAKTCQNVITNLRKYFTDWELIIVNDGSTDKTQQIADKIASKNPQVKVITHNPNRGYGGALKSGLYNARYPWITFIDADGQFDFSEIDKFLSTQQKTKADLVIGYYRKRQVSTVRKLNSQLWQLIVFILFGLKVRDIDCGFKLISKRVVDKIQPLESERGAFISSEFLIKARKMNFKIVEIPVHHYPREQGEATGAKLNVIVQSFKDLFALWAKLR